MRTLSRLGICLLVLTIFGGPVCAQTCVLTGPGVHPNVTAITAGTWAFRLAGFNQINSFDRFADTVGTFALSVAGSGATARGVLTSSVSVNRGGTIQTALMPFAGKWQLDYGPNGDCASGTMLLYQGSSIRFVLLNGGNQMYLLSTDNDMSVTWGEATPVNMAGTGATNMKCDLAGVSATAITAGPWSFRLDGFSTLSGTPFVAANGTFRARVGTTSRSTIPQGLTSSTININLNGTMYTVLSPVAGTFQIDPGPYNDCLSGTIQLGAGSNPATVRTLRFVLSGGGSRMYLLSVDNDGTLLSGEAGRQ